MTNDAIALLNLIKAMEGAKPHIDAMHDRIIKTGDRTAHGYLSALITAADELIEAVTTEDFMDIDLYGKPKVQGYDQRTE